MSSLENKDKLLKEMNIDYTYPDYNDPDFQAKIYNKREYYFNKATGRQKLKTYEDIKAYRDVECNTTQFKLKPQQTLLNNFIEQSTPYNGLLVFHGVGTGKTGIALTIAENFKPMIKKYNTKIYILVSGPLIKEQWKNELVTKWAKDTYLKNYDQNVIFLNTYERNKLIKDAKIEAMQYYRFMSLRSFQKKVLGQKIIEKPDSESDHKKKSYKKTTEGELERDIAIDKIDSLNNTLLIIDEAHNLTGNEYGDSVKKIINNSVNLRILLLSATPMKNIGEDIIDLINLLRPMNDQIVRDKVFINSGSTLAFKNDGKEYLRKMLNGYVSYFRGADPITFAEAIDQGEIPKGLIFTKVIRCIMESFQLKAYENIVSLQNDALDRKSQSIANFVFPYFDPTNKEIVGVSGDTNINNIRNQLKINSKVLLDKINLELYDNKYDDSMPLLINNEKSKSLSGSLFKEKNLKLYSVKFYNCLLNINEVVNGKKGAGTIFIYSNLVRIGIDLFREILLNNGYLEFNINKIYNITDTTLDSLTGLPYKEFIKENDISLFYPATFVTFTGKQDDEDIAEVKITILKEHFNTVENKDGKYIKIILGSRVMNEGITLKNIKEVHILDVYYNFGRLHQVVGRAVRSCVHYDITTNENPYPKVLVYKYVVSLPSGELSSEELLYQKAELKYILVKEIERILIEISIDCPLNYNANIFPEEVEQYKNCTEIHDYQKLTNDEKNKTILCPVTCGFKKCEYKCSSNLLNEKYYKNNTYVDLAKNNIDYTTFTTDLKKIEINFIKSKIKSLYKFKYVYTLEEFINLIKLEYTDNKVILFENYFLYQALHELIPIDENDFNNFQDIIYDKYNRGGYLIFRNKYYIFQPFNLNENISMIYRSTYENNYYNNITLKSYIMNTNLHNIAEFIDEDISKKSTDYSYDFSNMDYYSTKPEFIYVGIIDKEPTSSKYSFSTKDDIFKLRNARETVLVKKRGVGIPSLKGALCTTSSNKEFLLKIAKKIGIKDINKYTKVNMCKLIENRLLFLEKFSKSEDNNKYTYIILPKNHPNYPFPYNLEDRLLYHFNNVQNKVPFNLNYLVINIGNGVFEGIRKENLAKYTMHITNDPVDLKEYEKYLKDENFELIDNKWQLTVE